MHVLTHTRRFVHVLIHARADVVIGSCVNQRMHESARAGRCTCRLTALTGLTALTALRHCGVDGVDGTAALTALRHCGIDGIDGHCGIDSVDGVLRNCNLKAIRHARIKSNKFKEMVRQLR